ncbi:MAG: AmmeMemoRadiSam system protein B [Rhodospirillales bacterium]|nr:AmmeMemoRadiSam system protein B [Rhodospirillales bacterium]
MTHVRHAAVAGMFYPNHPRELDSVVRHYLSEAQAEVAPDEVSPKAIIAPHAGYVYSGAVAASAYVRLKPLAGKVECVVLLGPCHRVAVRGLAVSGADAFETPLGAVPVHTEALEQIRTLPQVQVFEATHRDEHSLEVHLPFLQAVLGDFRVVPLVVGQATAIEVAEVLEALWGGPETLIVISSDLSHYLDYDAARKSDSATCRAIEALDGSAIDYDQACGRIPIAGLLTVARRRGLHVTTLDLRNSGDTAGDKRRVVGYGAWMFTEPAAAAGDMGALLERHGETLLHVAAASIEHGLAHGRPLTVHGGDYAAALNTPGACFVTLKRNGDLRGCVGTPEAYRPLIEDVSANAFAAAFRDSRFQKLKPDERADLVLSVSVLSPPEAMTIGGEADLLAQLRPGIDGLIIQSGDHRALFLPQVWETLPQPRQFLAHLKQKAGLAIDHWSGDVQAWRFTARSISSDALPDPAALWS